MRSQLIKSLIAGLFTLITLGGCDEGYVNTRFKLSVENKTSILLRRVAFKMAPEGEFEFGVLSAGAEANYVNPPWKEIKTIHLSFEDDAGARFEFDLKTGVADDFRGEIRVQIMEPQGQKSAVVKLTPE